MLLRKLTLSLVALATLGVAHAQEEIPSQFYCDAEERFLSDEDFIRLALGYELEKMKGGYQHDHALPEGYPVGDIDTFIQNNPNCCSIDRDIENRNDMGIVFSDWIDRWLWGEVVYTFVHLPSVTSGEPQLILHYFTNECGEENGDRMYRFSNELFTE